MGNYDHLKKYIRTIPDWPEAGVNFRDITTLIKDPEGFNKTVSVLRRRYQGKKVDMVVGIESRGFIFGGALAGQLGVGFVPVRKEGKLPAETLREQYTLEYGVDVVEIHRDSVYPGQRVVVVDDLIATGGTALAACSLVMKLEVEVVEAAFVIDLPDLGGSKRLKKAGIPIFTMIEYEGE